MHFQCFGGSRCFIDKDQSHCIFCGTWTWTRSPLEGKMKYLGWHRVRTYRQTSPWLARRNQLVGIVHIFFNVAADTQLLPLSPKCFQTPAVSCLHSCLFCGCFVLPETFVKFRWRKTEGSHLMQILSTTLVSWWLGLLFFRKFLRGATNHGCTSVFASWQEVKKKKEEAFQ